MWKTIRVASTLTVLTGKDLLDDQLCLKMMTYETVTNGHKFG